MMKSRLRRLIPVILSGVLLIQPAFAAGTVELPEGYQTPFSDVSETQWFYPFVSALNSEGVIAGYDDGRFGPQDEVSVGAALVMVLKAAGCEPVEPGGGQHHWAKGYALFAVDQAGYVTEEEVANLDAPVTRELVARLAALSLNLTPSGKASPFADTEDEHVLALYQKGIVAGNQVGDQLLFKPEESITRAEVSAIVWQVMEYATHLHVGTFTVDILPDVPVSIYDPELFQVDEDGMMTYADEDVETSIGIDVSSFQGDIDWKKVKKSGVDFAMIRVGGRGYTVGNIYPDQQFQKNIEGALDAGLDVGVYFFSQAVNETEALEEANYVLEQIEGYKLTMPVVFDWENIAGSTEARTNGVDADTVSGCANAFCKTVEKAGYDPMIYLNTYIGYLKYDLSQVKEYPVWLAQYDEKPSYYYEYTMWQYTDKGTVDGVTGAADLNILLK